MEKNKEELYPECSVLMKRLCNFQKKTVLSKVSAILCCIKINFS